MSNVGKIRREGRAMKGVVFTEFLELVEKAHGLQVTDQVIAKDCPFHSSFTAVGTYDHRDLVSMIVELSGETGTAVKDLVHAFGKHLFHTFLGSYPEAFRGIDNTFDLLTSVERVIHVEVLKLTPDAELPRFEFPEAEPGTFNIEYSSTRPFADLAGGLIEACIEHFGESLTVQRTDLAGEPNTHALFHLLPCEHETLFNGVSTER